MPDRLILLLGIAYAISILCMNAVEDFFFFHLINFFDGSREKFFPLLGVGGAVPWIYPMELKKCKCKQNRIKRSIVIF